MLIPRKPDRFNVAANVKHMASKLSEKGLVPSILAAALFSHNKKSYQAQPPPTERQGRAREYYRCPVYCLLSQNFLHFLRCFLKRLFWSGLTNDHFLNGLSGRDGDVGVLHTARL
jgi:hypothetical protein